MASIAFDNDPQRVVSVHASDGATGEEVEIKYTNCKVIGNGSFGVVFQARQLGVPKQLEDIAIKKVLQDKRFKVCRDVVTRAPLSNCLFGFVES
jgi:hypothetical protein